MSGIGSAEVVELQATRKIVCDVRGLAKNRNVTGAIQDAARRQLEKKRG